MADDATRTAPYEWRHDSGRMCLDLMATAESRDDGAEEGGGEPLAAPGGLVRWLLGAGLLPPGTALGAFADAWAGRFAELRGWTDELVRAQIDGRCAEPALERVNAVAAGPPPVIRAVPDADGTLVRALGTAPECGALLAAVARDVLELLTDPVARARLRECQGERCHRVYLDTSRGRRRRWCSSEVCGNRERVARHRRRAAAVTRV
ncbi:CGNR zinc finger domain-containing protein [Streptomyces sp. CAU 1734]|uniref:CGNR zinc finger domain-containing protein n=1 Tax=Streptomyces sp. CAU 1734 TaxID=3140360 RepID=UPI0032602E7B